MNAVSAPARRKHRTRRSPSSRKRGHDVEHVDFIDKGASDTALAQYPHQEDRILVTYDDDFVVEIDESDYKAVLLFEDQTMSATEVAQIIQRMSDVYPRDDVVGLQKAGREWL